MTLDIPRPLDHHTALDMVLLQGPKRGLFLMREVALYLRRLLPILALRILRDFQRPWLPLHHLAFKVWG